MAKATKPSSTARRTAPKIEAPKILPQSERAEIYRRHSQAYLHMEPMICDIDNMATLAHDAVLNSDVSDSSRETNSLAHFAVFHLVDMIRDFHRRFNDDDFDPSGKEVE